MEDWQPDEGLVEKVRTGGASIKDLSDADRTWVVIVLLSHGWTAQDVADRLHCSLRLIRNIRADPLAAVALYALGLERALGAERAVRALEARFSAQRDAEAMAESIRLRRQLGDLVTQLKLERKAYASPVLVSLPTPRKRFA